MNENNNCPDCDSSTGVHDLYQPRSQAATVNLSCGRCKVIQSFRKLGPGLAYSCTDCGWFLGTPCDCVADTNRETLRFELKHLSIAPQHRSESNLFQLQRRSCCRSRSLPRLRQRAY
jgi:hypothetical protein